VKPILAKVGVGGSNPLARSNFTRHLDDSASLSPTTWGRNGGVMRPSVVPGPPEDPGRCRSVEGAPAANAMSDCVGGKDAGALSYLDYQGTRSQSKR